MPALIILAIITIAALSMAKFVFMKYVFIALIVLGTLLDMTDFIIRAKEYIKGKTVPSALPIFGFAFVTIGLLGLAVRSTITWKTFFLLLPLALFMHLSFQMLFPLVFTMTCNVCYKRKLFDSNPLPKNSDE